MAFNDTNGFFQMFETSSGNSEMAIVGTTGSFRSTAPGIYFVTPSTAKAPKGVDVARVNIKMVDGSIRWDKFAGLAGALTNGVKIEHISTGGATLFDFTDGHKIKINADFTLLAGVDSLIEPAAGDDALPIRWTLAKAGKPFHLNQGQSLRITIEDATSTITSLEAMCQGVYVE